MDLRERIWLGSLLLVLGAGAALVWSVALRPAPEIDTSPLERLPEQIGDWASQGDQPIEEAAESILRADLHVLRLYWGSSVGPVWLYIGYYGTQIAGDPEHTPEICYPSSGWEIRADDVVQVDPSRGLRVNELLVERDGQRQLVHYYYRSRERTGLLGAADQILDKLRSALSGEPGDGALVRASTIVEGGSIDLARSRLVAFTAQLDPVFDTHWPTVRP